MERRLAAILAADVAGYSHLVELNDEAAITTLHSYFAVAKAEIAAHRGRVFSTAGDSIVAEFPSIVDAIRAAVEIQHEISDRNVAVPDNRRMEFRIGVNLGDVIVENENLYGTGVNVAARLEQMADPGGICVSQTTYDQVRKIVAMSFEDIGEFRLKNIDDPVRVYRLLSTPASPLSKLFSSRRNRNRLAIGISLLVLLAIVGTSYLVFPDALRTAIFDENVPLPEHPSIAVLPFDDLSQNNDQEYLADGISEELITGLAKFPDLLVMARNSTFTYKGKPIDIRQVGKDLNVRYVVEGSLQKSDQNIRVTAQLIDAATGSHIWADRYDRELNNIFEIRDDITRAIAGTVMGTRGKIADAELERVSKKDPNSFTAYDNLLRGWSEWHKFTRENNLEARRYFEKATEVDPNYAYAYAGRAWTYSSDYDFGWTDDYDETLKLTLEMADKAVHLDNNDYKGHWVLGWAHLYSRQFDQALAGYERARDLNPNDTELLAEMGNMLIYVGQTKEAVEQLREAIRLNPHHEAWFEEYLGWALYEAGMPEEAIAVLEQVIDPNPTEEQSWVLPSLSAAYADPAINRLEDAHKINQKILVLDPSFSVSDTVARSPYKSKDQADRWANALRRAGLPN